MSTINKVFAAIAVAAAVYMLGTGAGIFAFGLSMTGDHPSDGELMRRFEDNRDAFSQLVAMSDRDSDVIRIAPDFTRLKTNWQWPREDSLLGFSPNRWDEYRSLFRKLQLQAGLFRDRLPDSSVVITLPAHSVGMVNRGSSKGYAFSQHQLTPSFVSLDSGFTAIRAGRKHGAAYRPIGGSWYLEYDW